MDTNSHPTPPPCPSTVTVRRNPYRKARSTNPSKFQSTPSSKLPEISSFPIQDILSEQIHQNLPSTAMIAASESPSPDSISKNLKVYLRIRPLVPQDLTKNVGEPNPRSRAKNVWPQNPSKRNSVKEKKITKKSTNVSCVKVNEDFHSVTLSPPLPLQETKRIKSEVYEGFSHVFSAESTQTQVYEKMVNPLVEDFLKGKSAMLVALGPTGSGKTHTVFGSPREPGVVPLILQRIFKPSRECNSQSSRQFYLSIFEIRTERGKAERICDLTSDGPDLCMQQSTIKGLQEVPVHDVAEAELLIARALLKRSTAMTNANSQSSRSQCIINIRRGTDSSDAETDEQSNSAVLSVVDLAGAEREKRTGNQGVRLAESNFINNTSMVFGLCLRSLLEHQKNPKKALHKHFQNSLLTRYLRDYLEGKKRMALILTLKSGEEDYLDASYLLRQASPYMKIKFTNIEAQSNLLYNKRQSQTISRAEQPKRMKLGNPDASVIEGKIVADENQIPDEDYTRSCNAEFKNIGPLNLSSEYLTKRERTHQIMQNFAKALWSVLKQQNEKLKVAESEILVLRENLRNEKKISSEMEQELHKLTSCCICSRENSEPSTTIKTKLDLNASNHIKSESSSSPRICDSIQGEDQILSLKNCSPETGKSFPTQQLDMCSQVLSHNISSNLSGHECIDDKQEVKVMVRSSEAEVSSPSISVTTSNCQSCQIHDESFPDIGNVQGDASELDCNDAEHLDPNSEITGFMVCNLSNASSIAVLPGQELGENIEARESPDLSVSAKDVERTQLQDLIDVAEAESEIRPDITCNSLKEKPKRRLLPASSILVKQISTLDADELDKPRGSGGGKNLAATQRQRTQGTVSLLRLLKTNLHSLV